MSDVTLLKYKILNLEIIFFLFKIIYKVRGERCVPEVEVAFLALVKVFQIVRTGREGNMGIILCKRGRHSKLAFL
jgi:hypothetical protein